jgi:Trypsin-co-occurring domain 2
MGRANWLIVFLISSFFNLPLGVGWADTIGVPIDELLSEIQAALIKVRDASEVDALPALTAVHLTLRATLSREAGGSLKFHVLEAAAQRSDESVQEIRIQLRPPADEDKSPTAASLVPLADAIIDAARSVKKAATGDPPLHLITLEASIEFTVEKEASGSIAFFGAKAGNRNTQQIILTFGKNE